MAQFTDQCKQMVDGSVGLATRLARGGEAGLVVEKNTFCGEEGASAQA